MPLIHFLLVYNIELGHLVDMQEFSDARQASERYAALERQYAGQDKFEIVLVGADSIETIKRTHGQYFNGARSPEASPYLTGV